MGNHLVGSMFNAGLSILSENEIDELTQEKALEIIDKIGKEVIETTSLDAEFDDYAEPNQKLGRVLLKAFLPEKYIEYKDKEYVSDEMDDDWYYKLWKPFIDRFGFW